MKNILASLKDPILSETALTVLEKRYLIKDENGKVIETPKEMFWRVAKHIASAEYIYAGFPEKDNTLEFTQDKTKKEFEEAKQKVQETAIKFYDMMASMDFLCNTPALINSGRPLGLLSACFILPIEDSMRGIYTTLLDSALIFQSGGGCGYSFSKLRPNGDAVKSTSGTASGVLSFMRVFNVSTDVVKQAGVRRGAMMGSLSVHHPEILDFISCKRDTSQLTNFNISVSVTDKFMKAVKENKDYELINPRNGHVVKKIKARDVFNKISENAWKTGEPGIVFIDTVNKFNPTPEIGEILNSNPCGEYYAQPYSSCNLGSINLSKFVVDSKFDYDRLKVVVQDGVHFLDNTIDVNKFPMKEIEDMTKDTRPIGLGVMGFADVLCRLGISYDSKEGLKFAEDVMSFIQKNAREKSIEVGKEKGICPVYGRRKDNKDKVRNSNITVLAPTGTISMIATCSAGIEPHFGLIYTKGNVLDGKDFKSLNDDFIKAIKEEKCDIDKTIKYLEDHGSIKDCEWIPQKIKDVFVTAHDISPEAHLKMQEAFQKHVSNGISKTINLPTTATKEDIEKIYMMAHDIGLKGVTVYRDGCRANQILSVGHQKKEEEKIVRTRKRPEITEGIIPRIKTGCGHMYITIGEDEKGICELFVNLGKTGGCMQSYCEALARTISLSFRSGVQVNKVIEELKGIRCPSPCMVEGGSVLSCADGIATALKTYLKHKNQEEKCGIKNSKADIGHNPDCPSCGSALVFKEGCASCESCGWSKCS